MTAGLVALVLTAALLHAVWNAMAKGTGAPELSIASYQLVGGLICLPLLWFVPFPEPESWPFLVASVLIHNVYYLTLSGAYRTGDLSQVYPLFRGLAPVLVAISAAVFAGEWLSVGASAGILLISVGIMSLALMGGRFGQMPPAALRYGLATSVMIAAYTVVDGLGCASCGRAALVYRLVVHIRSGPHWHLSACHPTRRVDQTVYGFDRQEHYRWCASSLAYGLVIFA